MKHVLLSFFAATLLLIPSLTQAGQAQNNLLGVQGYDLVAYHTAGKPVRGNGPKFQNKWRSNKHKCDRVVQKCVYILANKTNVHL